LMNGMEWGATGRLASLMGAIKIEHHGSQNHRISRADLDARFKAAFGFEL